MRDGWTHYTENTGLMELRRAIAAKLDDPEAYLVDDAEHTEATLVARAPRRSASQRRMASGVGRPGPTAGRASGRATPRPLLRLLRKL